MTAPAVPSPAAQARGAADTRSVCVVIPIPDDPPWELFDAIPADIPIIVSDDSDGRLAPPPRDNVYYFDYAAQQRYAGRHYAAMPHKSAASRNIGHYIAYREGFDVVVALDYDCGTRPGWLAAHLDALTKVVDAPALRPVAEGGWVNTVDARFGDGSPVYARGFPYEWRSAETAGVTPAVATGEVKMNMGVWERILDLNGIDKLYGGEPGTPGTGESTTIALGHLPVCGMNTAFAAELTPAYFFLPDIWVDRWQLSRHDDIWGGYVVKKLMDIRGDLAAFGGPVVEHTKQSRLERVVVLEQWMHLMSLPFYDVVDAAAEAVQPGEYRDMFAEFVDNYRTEVDRSPAPSHYRAVYRELGTWMQRWSEAFQ